MKPNQQKLSVSDRLLLIKTLNALPAPQFDEIVFALNPPGGNIPGNAAPQGNRSSALLAWVESTLGPGLSTLQEVLESILGKCSHSTQPANELSVEIQALQEIIKVLKENQAPKYDMRGVKFAGGFAENIYGDQVGGSQINLES